MEGNVKKVLSGVGFYGTLAVCLTIVGVCGWLLLLRRGGAPRPDRHHPPDSGVPAGGNAGEAVGSAGGGNAGAGTAAGGGAGASRAGARIRCGDGGSPHG